MGGGTTKVAIVTFRWITPLLEAAIGAHFGMQQVFRKILCWRTLDRTPPTPISAEQRDV